MRSPRGFRGFVHSGICEVTAERGAQVLVPQPSQILRGVVMGLVTNLPELKRLLGAASSDTLAQVLCLAYLRWGRDFNREVEGQFCGALYDAEHQRLVLFQDCVGLSTIYYRLERDGIRFSTLLMDLQCGRALSELDTDYMVAYLQLGGSFCELTPLRGVRRLLHGKSLVWQAGRSSLGKGWHPSLQSRPTSDGEMDARLLDLMKTELRGVAQQSSEVWCEVSGGLDSTSLYYLLKGIAPDVGAVSIISSSLADSGDTSVLRQLESDFHPRWQTLDADRQPSFSTLNASVMDSHGRGLGEPGGEIGTSLVHAYSDAIQSSRADVLVSGLGGDQVLGGIDCEPWHIADHMARNQWGEALRQARLWSSSQPNGRSLLWWLGHYGVGPAWRARRGLRISSGRAKVIPWMSGHGGGKSGEGWELVDVPSAGAPGSRAHWEEIALLATSESVSASARLPAHYHHPLLSRPIIELMLCADFRHRRLPNVDRATQRRALRGIVPAAVLDRVGKGTAQNNLMAGYAGNAEMRERLKRSRLVEMGIFDRVAWHLALDRFMFGVSDCLPQIYASMCLELWVQAFADGASAPAS